VLVGDCAKGNGSLGVALPMGGIGRKHVPGRRASQRAPTANDGQSRLSSSISSSTYLSWISTHQYFHQ
jgi:hypothetical protein